MNGNKFMGLRKTFDDGGCTNNAWQLIRGAPNKMVEDAQKALGNQWWRMHEQR